MLSVEDEFALSWDESEKWYVNLVASGKLQHLNPILELIIQLRERGYHRQTTAGHIMPSFILSRSLKHGLRYDQAEVGIHINPDGSMYVWYSEQPHIQITFEADCAILHPKLEELLRRLLEHPVN